MYYQIKGMFTPSVEGVVAMNNYMNVVWKSIQIHQIFSAITPLIWCEHTLRRSGTLRLEYISRIQLQVTTEFIFF